MHSTTCGVGASSTISSLQMSPSDGQKMVHSSEDPMNKIPLKSSSGLDDEERNGGEFVSDTAAAEEAKRERMRANVLKWMKKLTIGIICFIGLALITYVIISLCFSDWPKSTPLSTNMTTTTQKTPAHTMQETASPLPTQPSSKQTTTVTGTATTIASIATTSSSYPSTSSTSTPTSTSTSASPTTVQDINTSLSTTDDSTDSTAATTESSDSTSRLPTQQPFLVSDILPHLDEKFESKMGVFEHAAACTDRPICSNIAVHIMKEGGNAVDGAIAASLCNGITTMQSMGIGGGMVMNVYIKEERRAYSIDSYAVAPSAANPEMFDSDINLSLHGGLAIAVPGEVMGYHRAHKRFGKLPWKTLVEPSIKLCEEGIFVSKHMHFALELKHKHMKNNSHLTDIFYDAKSGEKVPLGSKIKPPKQLCSTYKMLAENGPLDFYNGTLAKLIEEDLQDMGSIISSYDLESYNADLVNSITMQLGNDTMYSMPPISSGTVVSSILSIMEGFNLTKNDFIGAENQARTMHLFAEAFKFGYAKRWELGDLRFNDVRELISQLTNPEYNMGIRARIDDAHVHSKISDYDAQFFGSDDVGTSHMSIVAPNGDAVSVTSSINDYFGCGLSGKRTGILFNSAMNDFSVSGQNNIFGLPPSPVNYIEGQKRPMSSMSPTILTDQNGDVRLVVGAAGGSKIISALSQIIARVLWFGQTIKEAIDAPRFHHQLLPDSFIYEYNRFDEDVIRLLEKLGHHTKPYKEIGSVACGIFRNETALYANADYRKRGDVAGY